MVWPFKAKAQRAPLENEVTLDVLMERVRADVERRGGFVIIGLSGEKSEGKDSMLAAVLLRNIRKSQVIYTIASSLGLTDIEVLLAMRQYEKSQVVFPSPLQTKDIGKV